jgi:hypothetical protein
MKTTISSIFTALLLSVSPAFASHFESDNSGILVWSFLGFCSLIVVMQLLPACMMMVGMVKGAVAKKVTATN